MSNHSVLDTLKKVHRRLNGSTLEFDLTSYQKTITEIHQHQSRLKEKTDAQLQKISLALRRRVNSGDDLNELLAETFALISESIWRIFKMHPFEGQLIGGIALHQGKLTEMPTGEGKTLMAVFPATLNALLGKGVHVLTFNDYLARRDMNWMDPVYAFL